MRPLTDEEMRAFFEKLQTYVGQNITKLIDRSDEPYTFRLIKDRVYYLSESQMKLASNIARDHLLSIGICFGKFTKSGKFRLHVTCLDYLAQYATYKVGHRFSPLLLIFLTLIRLSFRRFGSSLVLKWLSSMATM
jgi:60S ribosome subunit biogenesis protein NIP7